MISPEEAWQRLSGGLKLLPPENLPRRQARGRVLAGAVRADVDLPPCDMSAMDGYAVPEPVTAGVRLPVAGTIAAGDAPVGVLEPGTAVRIMTGAAVPDGADSVVPVEQTDGGSEFVEFTADSSRGAHIRRAGEVVRAGDRILAPGTSITPAVLGLLASHGVAKVAVHGAPRVATLATGDEILAPEVRPGPGQLRDTHTDFLLAAGASLGLDFHALGIARDTQADLSSHIAKGLDHDVLLISGGVSKGIFDLVEDVLAEHGCRTLFDAVAVQPGKPLVAAAHDRGWVFGLPGNPASAIVCFWLFVKPFLHRLMGRSDGFWNSALGAQLAGPLPGARGRDRFLTASIETRDGRLLATPLPPQGSHDIVAYGHGSALIRIRAHAKPAEAGAPCEVLLLPG